MFAELFFSQGSLLAATGCHLTGLLRFNTRTSDLVINGLFDDYFDAFFTALMGITDLSMTVVFDNSDTYVVSNVVSDQTDSNLISLHRF